MHYRIKSKIILKGKPLHFYLPDRIYFITTHTYNFDPIFLKGNLANILLNKIADLQTELDLPIYGYGIMHHHLHWMFETGDKNSLDYVMFRLKGSSSREINKVRGEKGHFWQERYQDHVVRNEKDFISHLNYIHYNAVKHRLVKKPEDWPFSSYKDYLEEGDYERGWGWIEEPKEVKDLSYELDPFLKSRPQLQIKDLPFY